MVAWIVISLWNILSLIVMFGPLMWCWSRWDKVDRAQAQLAYNAGLPEPKAPPGRTALRWAIGLGLFFACGYIANVMYEASEGLYWSIYRRSAL